MKLKRVLIALVLAPVLAACQSSGSGPEPEPRGTEDRRGYRPGQARVRSTSARSWLSSTRMALTSSRIRPVSSWIA